MSDSLEFENWVCGRCGFKIRSGVYPVRCRCGYIDKGGHNIDGPNHTGKSRGLGDTVAKLAAAVGIKKRKGCKCEERQDKLNRAFPYR